MKTHVMNKLNVLYLIVSIGFFVSSQNAIAQENIPKEAIFNKFEHISDNQKKINIKRNGKNGIYFKIGSWDDNTIIQLFYFYEYKSDTLSISKLPNLVFEKNITSINMKERLWYKKNTKNMHPIDNKNWVFDTYLVELISDNRFVIYPVKWLGEGYINENDLN